ncbi:hypothetical protein [Rhodococcus koreensis]
MPTAVVRVHFDPDGALSEDRFRTGFDQLTRRGLDVLAVGAGRRSDGRREIEVLTEEPDDDRLADLVSTCSEAFGVPTELGVVTYVSRGTDDDAASVLRRFELDGEIHREIVDDDEVVTVTLSGADARRVPESRLHTAMEAALNCEVRIVLC